MKVRVKLDKPILWRGGEDEMISKDFIFEHNPNDENDLGTQLTMIATSSTHAMMYKGVKKFSLEVVDEIQEG